MSFAKAEAALMLEPARLRWSKKESARFLAASSHLSRWVVAVTAVSWKDIPTHMREVYGAKSFKS
jgi:hypothetical protein